MAVSDMGGWPGFISDLRPGYRACVSGRRIIYYRIEEEFIYILTILHHSQDQAQFLSEADED